MPAGTWKGVDVPWVGEWIMRKLKIPIREYERLARRLEAEGGLPDDEVPASASGRVERAAADAVFERYAAEVQQHPESWQHWFRLALAYDAASDHLILLGKKS